MSHPLAMSRRQALKVGALVAGTAWVAPVVEPFHLTAGSAEATSEGYEKPPGPPPDSPPAGSFRTDGPPPGTPPGGGDTGGGGGTGGGSSRGGGGGTAGSSGVPAAKPAKAKPATGITYTG